MKLKPYEGTKSSVWIHILGVVVGDSDEFNILSPGLGTRLKPSWCGIVGDVDQNASVSTVAGVSDLFGDGPFRPSSAAPSRCLIPSAACRLVVR